jgi:hypothetical protein
MPAACPVGMYVSERTNILKNIPLGMHLPHKPNYLLHNSRYNVTETTAVQVVATAQRLL